MENQDRDAESAAYDVAEALENLPKTESEREAYDRVKRLAVEHQGTEDMEEHGAIDIVFELIGFIDGNIEYDPPEQDPVKAKAIMDLVKQCRSETVEDFETWLGSL